MRQSDCTMFPRARGGRLSQPLIYHQSARDLQLADGAGQQLLRLMQIAPGGEGEFAERAVFVVERGEHACDAHRGMRTGVEGQQQELEMRSRAVLARRGEA